MVYFTSVVVCTLLYVSGGVFFYFAWKHFDGALGKGQLSTEALLGAGVFESVGLGYPVFAAGLFQLALACLVHCSACTMVKTETGISTRHRVTGGIAHAVGVVIVVVFCLWIQRVPVSAESDSPAARTPSRQMEMRSANPPNLSARPDAQRPLESDAIGPVAPYVSDREKFVLRHVEIDWTTDRLAGDMPTLTVDATNGTDRPVDNVLFSVAVYTKGRSVPWAKFDLHYSIPGGIEAGEEARWQGLIPNILQRAELRRIPKEERDDLVVRAKVNRIERSPHRAIGSVPRVLSGDGKETVALGTLSDGTEVTILSIQPDPRIPGDRTLDRVRIRRSDGSMTTLPRSSFQRIRAPDAVVVK